jgi:hypothetical protein
LILLRRDAVRAILTTLVVDVFEVESVNMSRDISQQCEEDVDAQIQTAAGNQEDSEWGDKDLSLVVF